MCVARADGLVVFVRHALPGERVLAQVTETGRRYWRADAVRILEPSPDRVAEPCPHARPGRCGGCDWQHVTLSRQRKLKAAVIREQLRRLAGLDVDVQVQEAPASPDGLGWRTRVRFAVGADGRAGLHRHRSEAVERLEA
jgi:tRNA/tmRNA/rRNA uracil-C5-methylase (TrmA/RlmC/RlmD family)